MTRNALKTVSLSPIPSSRMWRDIREQLIHWLLFLFAFSAVAVTISIMYILISESMIFFRSVSIVQFLADTQWTPLFENARYGVWPLLCGTLVTTLVAICLAIPFGTIAAMYLSEFAQPWVKELVKPFLELLAGVPTVVYGYFALLVVTPLLQTVIPNLGGFNMLSPGLVMGIMTFPFICSISEDAMRAVPVSLREGSYAMGATRLQTAIRVVFPSAISGISSAYILGISRALGVTMVVAIAAGLEPRMTLNPLDSAATITAFIVQVSIGDLERGGPAYQSIFAVGLTLVVMTLLLNIIGHFLAKRYREVY